jgi:hypothetical protein
VESLPLTCEVIADPDFCWAIGVEEAYACVDASASDGVFDPTRSTCTMSDGVVIRFDEPVPLDSFSDDDYTWTFSIEDSDGAECARHEDGDSTALITASGESSTALSGMVGVRVTCPDGGVYVAPNAFDLFECEVGSLPGYSVSGSSDISWSLLGTPDDRFGLFSCADPAVE